VIPGADTRSAFTLLEILVVVFLLGILAAVAIPSLSGRMGREAEMEGDRIKETLNHAQALAFARNTEFQVAFQVGGTLVALSRVQLGPGPIVPDADDYAWNLRRGTIQTADFGGSDTVVFDGKGRPSSAGTVEVDYAGRVMTISVTEVTGLVTIAGIP
jgi:prepilin-type N-terminal cleavage/methylation domain-containing protein